MNLEKLTIRVANELQTALPDNIPADERKVIVDIVRQAMQDASKRTHRELRAIAMDCCGHEADLAHKIQDTMHKKREPQYRNWRTILGHLRHQCRDG